MIGLWCQALSRDPKRLGDVLCASKRSCVLKINRKHDVPLERPIALTMRRSNDSIFLEGILQR